MTERAYTVSEIDALRKVVYNTCVFGNAKGAFANGCGYEVPRDIDKTVEERVRTYMVGGITAKDILENEERAYKEWQAKIEEHRNGAKRDQTDNSNS
jgi:hypothetical protein